MANRIAYPLGTPTVGHGYARIEKALGGVIPILAADVSGANTVQLFRVPAGFVVAGLVGEITDVDTSGAPAILFTIGDAASANRLVASSNVGQTGGVLTRAIGALGYKYPADTDIVLTVATPAAAAAAGTLALFLLGFIEPVS